MGHTEDIALRNFWYLVAPGSAVPPGRTVPKRLAGEPILLGRTRQGAVFALRDICPHRGIPLRYGHFDGHEIACCYHGWTFAPDGRCTGIPSLVEGQALDVEKIKVRAYPSREVQGNIWVYLPAGRGRAGADEATLPEVPRIPDLGDAAPRVSIASIFPCDTDHAAFGLMDPTHAAFVHTSWWWKRKARTLRRKEKNFEPAPLGWRMVRHRLPSESLVYKLLGRDVTTEITYSLPGLRIESICGERHKAVGLTAITPVSANETEVHQSLYWTMPWLAPLTPLARRLAAAFLAQDRDVVARQQEGLADDPTLMLIDDADTQAKWFARLKREWLRAEAEGRPFENPVRARTLRWHS